MITAKINIKEFSLDMKKVTESSIENLDQRLKVLFLDTFNKIQIRTPVDTGDLRSRWKVIIQHISAFNDWKFENELPYASKIEFDSYSKQAPLGMARISIEELITKIENLQRLL
jgi:hypothetical protein